jgi:hypothetical protein
MPRTQDDPTLNHHLDYWKTLAQAVRPITSRTEQAFNAQETLHTDPKPEFLTLLAKPRKAIGVDSQTEL